MRNGFVSGVTTGAVIGAAIGMMMLPEMDRNTRKKIKRSSKMIKNMASGMTGMMDWMR